MKQNIFTTILCSSKSTPSPLYKFKYEVFITMLRISQLTSLLVVTLSLTSCSWITTFVVANKSDFPVVVEYRLSSDRSNLPACPDDRFVQKPKLIPVADIKEIYNSKDFATYTCSSEQRTVKLTLNSGYAVSVFTVSTFTGQLRSEQDVVSFSITGQKGSMTYTGFQLTSNFKKHSDTLYILSYQ